MVPIFWIKYLSKCKRISKIYLYVKQFRICAIRLIAFPVVINGSGVRFSRHLIQIVFYIMG